MPTPPSQREPARWSVTIDTDNVRRLLGARYFLAGLSIGTALLLLVFLIMR